MALQPSLRPLIVAGSPNAPHTIDIFLDYVCPFSAKTARTINAVLRPLLGPGGKYDGKAKVIFRPQVQPWHATSTYVHEAGLAALRSSPENFWAFSLALFNRQEEYFDEPANNLTPVQIREKLAQLASIVLPANAVNQFSELIKLKGSGNSGTAVTDDLKYTIKFARQNSIHVSPTVLFDGLVFPDHSSSWGEKEWTEFLEKRITV